jgi:hypothetical protein
MTYIRLINYHMAQNLYIVLHIYKTAGQTLGHNFLSNLKSEELLNLYADPIGLDKRNNTANPGWDEELVRRYVEKNVTRKTKCLFGHMVYFGIEELLSSEFKPLYITFLRDPVERVVSLYYYLRNKSTNVWHSEIVENNWSIDDWLEKSNALWTYDGQLRQLLLGTYGEALTEKHLTLAHLEEGKKRLQKFWFVGLNETFQDDSSYIYGKLGFLKINRKIVVNSTPGKKDLLPRTRELIVERNQLDAELYRFARKLHADFVLNNNSDFRLNRWKAAIVGTAFSVISPAWNFIMRVPAH